MKQKVLWTLKGQGNDKLSHFRQREAVRASPPARGVTTSWIRPCGVDAVRWVLCDEEGRCSLENYWEKERLHHLLDEREGSPPDSAPRSAHCLTPHSTWSWHLGQIHMPLGIVFRGGSKQSRWYTREHVSHISNWPLFLQTLQKSSWMSP